AADHIVLAGRVAAVDGGDQGGDGVLAGLRRRRPLGGDLHRGRQGGRDRVAVVAGVLDDRGGARAAAVVGDGARPAGAVAAAVADDQVSRRTAAATTATATTATAGRRGGQADPGVAAEVEGREGAGRGAD